MRKWSRRDVLRRIHSQSCAGILSKRTEMACTAPDTSAGLEGDDAMRRGQEEVTAALIVVSADKRANWQWTRA